MIINIDIIRGRTVEMSTLEQLEDLIGKEVVVAITKDGYSRNHFNAQISICGILEKHPEDVAFRFLIDDQTFSYFEEEDIISVNKEASKPIIMLTIPVQLGDK